MNCDNCGTSERIDTDEILCRLCKLRQQAAVAEGKGWLEQLGMIRGMIRLERYQRGDAYHFPAPPVTTAGWDDLAWSRFVTFDRR